MAELATATGVLVLLMDHDQTASTSLKRDGRYKRGDIVAVYPPGKTYWRPPAEPWLFVEVTGTIPFSFAQVKARYEQMERVGAFDPETGDVKTRPIRRRVFHVNLDALPLAVRNALATDRYVSVPWTAVRAYIRNKVTNETEG